MVNDVPNDVAKRTIQYANFNVIVSNNKLMKNFLLMLAMALVTIKSYAYDLEIDGIFYNLDYDANTAEVTFQQKEQATYSGDVVIPASITFHGIEYPVTSIGHSAFGYSTHLTSVSIPNSVTTIDYAAFYSCTRLTSVSIPNSVTSIGGMAFYYCLSLTSVTIPSSVTSICGSVFAYCVSLTSVTIPNSVTSIGSDAFYRCRSLTSLTIPNSVTSIGGNAFRECSNLASLTIPNSVTSIGSTPFYSCSGLTSIEVDGGNEYYCSEDNVLFNKDKSELLFCVSTKTGDYVVPNSVKRIGSYAFFDCSGLTSVTIPNSVTSIGDLAFWWCTGLTTMTIPNSVTSIGICAFDYCIGLTSVTIGSSVTSIDEEAFWSCYDLNEVICLAEEVPATGSDAFKDVDVASATLMVPLASVEKYKAADQWKEFGTIIGIDVVGISSLSMDNSTNDIIYDVRGNKLTQPQKGVNIINGRKALVR